MVPAVRGRQHNQHHAGMSYDGIDISHGGSLQRDAPVHHSVPKVYYGFIPVATPYGNISTRNELGGGLHNFDFNFNRGGHQPHNNEIGSDSYNTINFKRKRQTSQRQTETENYFDVSRRN